MAKKKGNSGKKKKMTKAELEEALVENFVSLQKVLTNLSVKFEDLTGKISSLLQLFEISAKSFTKKQEESGNENKELAEQVQLLLEQNKIIAKGITLIEEEIRHNPSPFSQTYQQPRPLPRF